MKLNNIFKIGSTLIIGGLMAFTVSSCDSQSSKEIAEDNAVTEIGGDVNEDDAVANEPLANEGYDFEREYAYEERDIVIDRVRNDIDRADRELEEIDREIENAGKDANQEAVKELEESKRTIKQEKEKLSQKLNELEQASQDNWNQVRNDVNQSLQTLEKEWESLKDKDVDVDVNVEDEGTNQ